MKKAGKRLLSYLLVLAMLMSLYTPVYGAETSAGIGTGTQAVENKEQEQQSDQEDGAPEEGKKNEGIEITSPKQSTQDVKDENNGQDGQKDIQDNVNTQNPDSSEDNAESDVLPEEEKTDIEEFTMVCNYIFTQEDDSHQSVIVEVGEQSSTLDSAQITYQDSDGELHTADAEEVAENIAAFLLELPQQGQERTFVSMKAVVGGQEYNVSLNQDEEDMAQIELGAEEVTQTVEESKNEEAGLDVQAIEQVEKGVISADENGISPEDIKDAINKNNQLSGADSNEIAAFSLGEDASVPAAISAEPKKGSLYCCVRSRAWNH